MNNWLIGAPILAAVIAGWGTIKNFLSKLRSLVLFQLVVSDGTAADAIAYYCWQNMKRVRMGDRWYGVFLSFVKPENRREFVSFESISKEGVIFYDGWRVLYVGTYSGPRSSSNSGYSSGGGYILTFLRGAWKPDELFQMAIDAYNSRTAEGFKSKRFFVRREYGSFGQSNMSGDQPDSESPAVEAAESSEYWTRRLLKYDPDDLGQPQHEDKHDAFGALAFPDEIMSAVTEIDRWARSKNWYSSKSIPWKRGWLLYGPPGTGKTSLIRAIGEYLDLPVIVFVLSTFTDRDFQNEWSNLQRMTPCIALIEDIDTVFRGRTNILKGSATVNPLSFDVLLNTIDGIEISDGIFTIVTTNSIEHLDKALAQPDGDGSIASRPGRIDRVIELFPMAEKERWKIAKRILSDCPEYIDDIVKIGNKETGAQFVDRCAKVALKEYWERRDTPVGEREDLNQSHKMVTIESLREQKKKLNRTIINHQDAKF